MTDLCCPDVGKVPKDVSKVLFADVHHLCDELPPLDVGILFEVDLVDEVVRSYLLLSDDDDASDDGDADVDVIF